MTVRQTMVPVPIDLVDDPGISAAALGVAVWLFGRADDEIVSTEITERFGLSDAQTRDILVALEEAGAIGDEIDPLPEPVAKRRVPATDAQCSVYIVSAGGRVKVGISGRLGRRLNVLRTSNPDPIQLHFSIQVQRPRALEIERLVLAALSAHRIQGEWISADPEMARHAVMEAFRATGGAAA